MYSFGTKCLSQNQNGISKNLINFHSEGSVLSATSDNSPRVQNLRLSGRSRPEAISHLRDDFQAKAEQLRRDAMNETPLAELSLAQAGSIWLKNHARYIKPRTLRDYEQYLKTLSAFFTMPLSQIHIGTIRFYQEKRAEEAGHGRINMELSTLQQVLKEAKLWAAIEPFYRPMPTSQRGSGRSANKEDEQKLLDIAFRNRRRRLAAHCVRIMLRCGVGFGELSRIKRRDVDLKERVFEVVEGAKNKDRERLIPLSDEAFESMAWLIERYESLKSGDGSPDDFILPHCSSRKNGPRDFTRPMLSIKKAWAGIRAEAVKEIGPHMAKFRIYDCRVTAVTKALSSGRVSIHTAEKLFGHVSQAMQRRYYKPTMSVLREAVEELEKKA
jgi:integrase